MAVADRACSTWLNQWVALAVPALAMVTLVVGVLIPIYSDEIAIQMARARFFVEGGALLNLAPQCRSLVAVIPVSWYPGAVFNAILYSGAGDLGLRIRGMAVCAGWLSLMWVWAGRHPQTLIPRRSFQSFIISLNMLGVLPFVLVLARSEQLLVLALIAYCMLALFWRVEASDGISVTSLKAALLFSITSVFLLTHPKALFFAPVILGSTWLIFRSAGKTWMIGIMLAIGFAVLQSVQYVLFTSSCPGAPAMAKVLAQHTLDFQLLATDKSLFFKAASSNLASSLGLILDRMPATLAYQSNWLPFVQGEWMGPWLGGFGKLLKASLYILALVSFVATIVRFVMQLSNRRLDKEVLLSTALLTGLVLHGVVYNTNAWHFYTPGLIVPLLSVLLMLMLHTPFAAVPDEVRRASSAFALYWMSLAIASMVLLLGIQTPGLLRLARIGDYVITSQPLSTPAFVREEERARLSALAKRCNIQDGDERLVLDGAAYFLFQHGRQPINVFYVSDYAFGMDIGQKLPEFLKKIDSGGILSRCEYLPKALSDRAIRSDKMCCVSKADL